MKKSVSKPRVYKVNGHWYASVKIGSVLLLAPGQATIEDAWKVLQSRASLHYGVKLTASRMAGKAQKSEADFKQYLIDQLLIYGIYRKRHENDPAEALNDLIQWNVDGALDPEVSSDAVDLQNQAYQRAVDLCLNKDYGFDIDTWSKATKREISAMMARAIGEEIKKCILPL